MERVQRGEEPWDCRHVDSCGEGERQVAKEFVYHYLSWELSLAESSTAPFTARQARATTGPSLWQCFDGSKTSMSLRRADAVVPEKTGSIHLCGDTWRDPEFTSKLESSWPSAMLWYVIALPQHRMSVASDHAYEGTNPMCLRLPCCV